MKNEFLEFNAEQNYGISDESTSPSALSYSSKLQVLWMLSEMFLQQCTVF
jgi:hypothetical protein